jgi:hypothetical protein
MDIPEFVKSGWFIAIVAATWGVILRVMVGKYEASNRRQEGRLDALEENVNQMQIDLAGIAGVLKERGRSGRYTWPQGHD